MSAEIPTQSIALSLNPMLRVGKQIANVYGAHNKATAREERQKAIEMLRMVGINDPERRVDAYAHELSGGMAQRALIAMALSSSPRLLIADETTSGLEPIRLVRCCRLSRSCATVSARADTRSAKR